MSQGIVYNIQRMSTRDGPGIRTTVFLKGCPLRCLWCSNPESQQRFPQTMFFRNLCTGCGKCVEACPNGAININHEGIPERQTQVCTECGKCAETCPAHAREISGKIMTVEEVMNILRKDELFYENSGGGITFGGGEPTSSGEFLIDMAQASQNEGWHVTIDTCGYCPSDNFRKTLASADLALFDCKHMDPVLHKKLTGVDNRLILENLKIALESDCEIRIRMPLMPELNDGEENLEAMAQFLIPFGHTEIEIMPCHFFGKNKYEALGMPFPKLSQYSQDALKQVRTRFVNHGLKPVIV